MIRLPVYRCYEGHEHVTREGAARCDREHWAKRVAEYGLEAKPLRIFEAPEKLEQTELFEEGE